MRKEILQLSNLMLVGTVIVIVLLSGVKIQPIATGDVTLSLYENNEYLFTGRRYANVLDMVTGKLSILFPWMLPPKQTHTYLLKTFSSEDEFRRFFTERYGNSTVHGLYYCMDGARASIAMSPSAKNTNGYTSLESVDFSQTNIQVEGVDEPDIVKTDGTYLYIVASSKIYIVKAYPAEEAALLSEISMNSSISLNNIFVHGDHLIVFGNSYRYPSIDDHNDYVYGGGFSTAIIKVFDMSNRETPVLEKEVTIDGSYFDARMIGNYVYIITTESTYEFYRTFDTNASAISIPQLTIDDETMAIPLNQIYYVDVPELADTMTHVLSININTEEVVEKSFLLGSSQTMYVSEDNIFLAYTKYEYYPPLPGENYGRNEELTLLHKISVHQGDIAYVAQGEVPGRILNQFSMDEHNGFFRIATTIGHVSGYDSSSSNNIYILDEHLQRVSEIEDIAPGEQIHSARFMGNKAYLVTFKKIDPFFTIDLSDPYNPKILGALKIPGYSDYLHPYDENHIIGIGKDTVEPSEGESGGWSKDFAWYQGIKIALFDVSDFKNPKELTKIVIGDRGTDSIVLRDHKAFLFDCEKGLLVIPVNLYEISEEIKESHNGYTGNIRGQFTFQGAYVYHLNLEDGFEFRGRITHMNEQETQKTGTSYWYQGSSQIYRSLYIGNILYTLSDNMVKMNDLQDLTEISSVSLL